MAELVFNLDDVTLETSWTVWRESQGKEDDTDVPYSTNLAGSSSTKSVSISGIPDGEVVKRAMLTATLNRVGVTDYGETIKVNNLNFGTGVRKLDSSLITNNIDMSFQFYFCASGEAGFGLENTAFSNYSCTLYISDITLTLTTGTGSAFDGQISSLPEGSKILVDEPDGVQGTYSVVHHGYGSENLCLLWRDNCVETTIAFNQNADTFLADNYGKLDEYLNATFYNALPDSTKPYIQSAIYPTLDKCSNGTVINLERYVCTPSVRELKETTGAAEWHGVPLDYLGTVDCDAVYWTRSVKTNTAEYAYRINAEGASYTYNRGYASGVRPCFCVLEEQLVKLDDDGTHYMLASAVSSPTNIYLNGTTTDLIGRQRDITATLSWDAVTNALVTGYEVWSCDTADGDYAFLGAVTADDEGTVPTELTVRTGNKGFETLYYKVKAVTTPDTDYLDSSLCDACRMLATKRTNVHYYNGIRWLLAATKHYNGSAWVDSEGAKYYDGTQWIDSN